MGTTNIQMALSRYRGLLNKNVSTQFFVRHNLKYLFLNKEGLVVDDVDKAAWIVELSMKNILGGSAIYYVKRNDDNGVYVLAPSRKRTHEYMFLLGYAYSKWSEYND